MQSLQGRVAVVTGGANGIGLGLAERFAREGMKVVIADNDADDLARAQKRLAELGEVLAVRTDVADASSVQALADATTDRFGAAHVLCNNAGVGGLQRFASTTLATWRWTLGVNLHGVIHGCHAFLPVLAAQDEAHIVNTASMAGFVTGPYMGPYYASKAAVVALSESLAAEFAVEYPHIGVSVLCPAYSATSIRHDERNAPDGHVPRSVSDPDLDARREVTFRNIEQGMSTEEIAARVVDGIRTRRTHIFTHPEWLDHFLARARGIADAAAADPA